MSDAGVARMLEIAPRGLVLRASGVTPLAEVECVPFSDPARATLTSGEVWLGAGTARCGPMTLGAFCELVSSVFPRELVRVTGAHRGEPTHSGDELVGAFEQSWAGITRTPVNLDAIAAEVRSEGTFDIEPDELVPPEIAELFAGAGERIAIWSDKQFRLQMDGSTLVTLERAPSLSEKLEAVLARGHRRRRLLAAIEALEADRKSQAPTAAELDALRRRVREARGKLWANAGADQNILYLGWNDAANIWTLGCRTPAFAHRSGVDDLYVLWPESAIWVEIGADIRYARGRSWLHGFRVGDDLAHHPFVARNDRVLCVEDTVARASALETSLPSQLRAEVLAARDCVLYGYGLDTRPHQAYPWTLAEGKVAGVRKEAAVAWALGCNAEVVEWTP